MIFHTGSILVELKIIDPGFRLVPSDNEVKAN